MKIKNTYAKLKLALTKFLTLLSLHGVSHIMKTQNTVVKLTWFVAILISVSMGCFLIEQTISDYNRFDVFTNTKRIHKPLTFPGVVFCLTDDEPKQTIREIVNSVTFIGRRVKWEELEFYTALEFPYSLHLVCMRFNGFKNASIPLEVASRIDDSLCVSLKKGPWTVIFFLEDNYIKSHGPHFSYVYDMSSTGLIQVFINDVEIENKQGYPFNDCDMMTSKTYRQYDCIEQCIHQRIASAYNCYIYGFYSYQNLKQCRPELISNITESLHAACEVTCPAECVNKRFIYTASVTYWSKQTDFSEFTFRFTDLSILVISQVPKMSLFVLISSLGGSLGLFMGLRFLSLVEILEFFIEIAYISFFNRLY